MTFCFCYQLLDSKPLTTEIGYAAHAFVSAIHVVSSSRSIASAKFLSTHLIYISTTISSPSKQRHSNMRSRVVLICVVFNASWRYRGAQDVAVWVESSLFGEIRYSVSEETPRRHDTY